MKPRTHVSGSKTPMLGKMVNGIILAGGKNSRMNGEDKAFLEIGGRPIVSWIIDKLKPLVRDIIIITNSPPERFSQWETILVRDEMPNKGPLVGIYSGLRASLAKYNFVCACDMPFLNKDLISYMIKNIDGYDVLVPRVDGRLHPLCGVYSKNCVSFIEEMLKEDRFEVRGIFPKVKSRFLSKAQIQKFDINLMSLVNINTRNDLLSAYSFIGNNPTNERS